MAALGRTIVATLQEALQCHNLCFLESSRVKLRSVDAHQHYPSKWKLMVEVPFHVQCSWFGWLCYETTFMARPVGRHFVPNYVSILNLNDSNLLVIVYAVAIGITTSCSLPATCLFRLHAMR